MNLRIESILYCDTLPVSCGDVKTEWEFQVDTVYRWGGQHLLEGICLAQRIRGCVDLPALGCVRKCVVSSAINRAGGREWERVN